MTVLDQTIAEALKNYSKEKADLTKKTMKAYKDADTELTRHIKTVMDLRAAIYRGKPTGTMSENMSAVTMAVITLETISKQYNRTIETVRVLGQSKRVHPSLMYMVAEFEHASLKVITDLRGIRKKVRAAIKAAEKE